LTASNKGRKTFVLDTSVLLADPGALARFAEHEVVVPIAVIGELETKRDLSRTRILCTRRAT
jgi:PhoH-like ATPase